MDIAHVDSFVMTRRDLFLHSTTTLIIRLLFFAPFLPCQDSSDNVVVSFIK